MRTHTFGLTAGILLVAAGAASAESKEVITNMPAERIERMVKAYKGVSGFEKVGDGAYRFTVVVEDEDFLMVLFNKGPNMQLYAGFSEIDSSVRRMNEWNRDHRYTRAYLDDEDDPILESDIDLAGGVTEENVDKWFDTFARSLAAFYTHISK